MIINALLKITFSATICVLLLTDGRAQTVTSTATAEECRKVIAEIGKLGKSDTDRITAFSGSSITIESVEGSLLFRNTYSNIDWGTFREVSLGDPLNGSITVSVMFDADTIGRVGVTVGEDGSTTGRNTAMGGHFFFAIPEAHKERVKDIEAAAKRLAQLTKEKDDPFASARTSRKPADGKPTYQETIAFLESKFRDRVYKDGFEFGYEIGPETWFFRRARLKLMSFSDDCVLNIEYGVELGRDLDAQKRTTIKRRIDFKQLESISLEALNSDFVDQLTFWLVFNEKITPRPIENLFGLPRTMPDLPLTVRRKDTKLADLKGEHVYKAFNHLRKLCGAPEPIEFN